MALMALVQAARRSRSALVPMALIILGIIGAALFYGDGTITPAISVLSAVEGLEGRRPRAFASLVDPDRRRDPVRAVRRPALRHRQRSAALFGPVMMLWFIVARRRSARVEVAHHPQVLGALSPGYAVAVLRRAPTSAFIALGRGRARGHRRRGALRRHGSLRRSPIRPRLVLPRLPGADAQLLRPGRAARSRDPAPSRTRSTCSLPSWALYPDGGAGDRRDDHRLAGGDLGRLRVTQQAVQLGFLPALCDPPHLRARTSARSTCLRSTEGCSPRCW